MPEKKGRKRRQRERRHGEPSESRTIAPPPPPRSPGSSAAPRPASEDLPKLRVRFAGFVLALLTLFVGILTAAQGIIGGGSAASLLTFAAGAGLVALAIVIGALTLVPERVRALFARK